MHVLLSFCILISSFAYPCKSITVATNPLKLNKIKTAPFEDTSTRTNVQETQSTSFPRATSTSSSKQEIHDTPPSNVYDTVKQLNLIMGNIPTTSSTNPDESIVNTYRVTSAEDGTTCILMAVDALITFFYTTKLHEVEETDAFVPAPSENRVFLTGDCSKDEKSSMMLKWKTFALNFDFTKTANGEKWFIDRIQLSFSTKEKTFRHPIYDNTYVRTSTAEGDNFFATPVGRAFKCHQEVEVALSDPEYPDFQVKLLLRELTLQPFMLKTDNFGSEYSCAAAGTDSFRSETVPFVFGTFMTIVSLCTIGGYASYRFVKVNKVEYNSME